MHLNSLSLLQASFDLDPEMATPGKPNSSESNSSTCKVCQEQFEDPRLLACLHSFCRKCLVELWYNSSECTSDGRRAVHCPLCGSVCLKSKDGIEGLLKDVTCTLPSKDFECASCKEEGVHGDPTAWCGKCQAAFCNDHARTHKITYNSHNLSPLTDRAESVEYLCTEHNQPLDNYCGHCEAAVCGHCTGSGKHVGHKLEKIGAMIKRRTEKISAKVTTLENLALPRAEKDAKSVNESIENLRSRAEQLQDDVREARKKIMERVDTDIAKKLQEIDNYTERANLAVLELYSQNGIKNLKECVKAVVSFMTRWKPNEHGKENIASLLGAVEERLDLLTQLVKKGNVLAPLLNLQMQSPIKISADVGSMIGKVVTCKASASHSYVVHPVAKGRDVWSVMSVGGTAAIVVQARDAHSHPLSAGGDIIKPKWLRCDAVTKPTVDVIDYDNGRYLLTFTLQEKGKYVLAVIVNDCQMEWMVLKDCRGPPPVTFDPEVRQGGIVVAEDCRRATLSGRSGLKVFMGQLKTTRNKQEWMVKVSGELDLNDGCQIGVAARSHCQEIVSNSCKTPWDHLVIWNGQHREEWAACGNGYGLHLGDSWKRNDTIHVHLNLKKRTLRLINLRSGRNAYFETLPREELVPIFYLGCHGSQESEIILLE